MSFALNGMNFSACKNDGESRPDEWSGDSKFDGRRALGMTKGAGFTSALLHFGKTDNSMPILRTPPPKRRNGRG